jgi:hypothetical protein
MLWACDREVCGEEYWKESPGEAVRAATEVWLAMKVSRGMPATTPGGLQVSVDGDEVHVSRGSIDDIEAAAVIGCTEEIWRRRIRNLTQCFAPHQARCRVLLARRVHRSRGQSLIAARSTSS